MYSEKIVPEGTNFRGSKLNVTGPQHIDPQSVSEEINIHNIYLLWYKLKVTINGIETCEMYAGANCLRKQLYLT